MLNIDELRVSNIDDIKITVGEHFPDGEHPKYYLILDNFWANPEILVDYANHAHFSRDPDITGNYPGARTECVCDFTEATRVCETLWRKHTGAQVHLVPTASFPKLSLIFGDKPNFFQRMPHTDKNYISIQTYLNEDNHSWGGTAFYQHIESSCYGWWPWDNVADGEDFAKRMDKKFGAGWFELDLSKILKASWIYNSEGVAPNDELLNEGNAHWRKTAMVDAKFNRTLLFDASCFHSQYLLPEDYDKYTTHNPRIALNNFFVPM